MKALPENAYTFRTIVKDDYLKRVIEEADATTNFLLVTDEHKLDGSKNLVLLVRKPITALGALFPEKYLGPEPLSAWFDEAASNQSERLGDFVGMTIQGDNESLASAKQTVEHQIRHLNNILKGRIIQVTVQSF
jgi:hypothetical protein